MTRTDPVMDIKILKPLKMQKVSYVRNHSKELDLMACHPTVRTMVKEVKKSPRIAVFEFYNHRISKSAVNNVCCGET